MTDREQESLIRPSNEIVRYHLAPDGFGGITADPDNENGPWVKWALVEQLRGNLSLAEEGLANAMQENERLQRMLTRIVAGPPVHLPNDEVAAWAADVANIALRTAVETPAALTDAEIAAAMNDPAVTEHLIQIINIDGALSKMSAEKLVDVALEHVNGLNQHEELILFELCSRIDPKWSERVPAEKANPPQLGDPHPPSCACWE